MRHGRYCRTFDREGWDPRPSNSRRGGPTTGGRRRWMCGGGWLSRWGEIWPKGPLGAPKKGGGRRWRRGIGGRRSLWKLQRREDWSCLQWWRPVQRRGLRRRRQERRRIPHPRFLRKRLERECLTGGRIDLCFHFCTLLSPTTENYIACLSYLDFECPTFIRVLYHNLARTGNIAKRAQRTYELEQSTVQKRTTIITINEQQ
mmetsp:Transcript_1795/g.4764  ORF Transcript_1795/g.4764 Transcript_1795/m.4764 type:complete len:202 (+) Transcript_1795:2224-2829(+)